MAALLQAERLHKSFGPLVLFENLNMNILEGDKSALIAPNGSGKSSLLHILAGQEPSEQGGTVQLHPHITCSFLVQNPVFNPEHSVFEAVFSTSGRLGRVVREYESAVLSKDSAQIAQAMTAMDQAEAWDYEQGIKQILFQLKITDLTQKMGTLSGGQRKRVALAGVLIHEPDLLILDEPTNHLDISMIEWLEEYLKKSCCTLLMVTHDRYFLDRICNRIYELDHGTLYTYDGNYSYYLEKREERLSRMQTEVDRAKNLLRTELEWMRRMPQARAGKAKYRINAFYELADKAAQQYRDAQLKINVQTARLGKKIIECKHLCHAYGAKKTLEDFSYSFSRMEKVGIVGDNGVGKSTLLNILSGRMQALSGEIERGETLRIGYYNQEGLHFKPGQKVIEIVREIAEVVTLGDGKQLSVRDFLQYFLFPLDTHYTAVEKLSGGEKRRLYLLTVLMQQPNFLILDEPTNDLDIMTLNVLEEYLQFFPGCVLLVSHDRYFIDKIAEHLFVFQGDGVVKDFVGDYSEYRAYSKQLESHKQGLKREELQKERLAKEQQAKTCTDTGTVPSGNLANRETPAKRKRSFKEQREWDQLESDIALLEAEKSNLEARLSSGTLSPVEIQTDASRIGEVIALLDAKGDRWLELCD